MLIMLMIMNMIMMMMMMMMMMVIIMIMIMMMMTLALVIVENLCISEASIHFPRQLLERSMRKRVTYRASPEYGLISIFHSVKNAYFITPHAQQLSRNAKCSLFVPRPLRRAGLFLRE